MSIAQTEPTTPTDMPFFGLAPFLRLSIAGSDLLPYGQEMLALAEERPDDANLWMNLSLAMQCLGQRELGLAIQAQALEVQRFYYLAATEQPAKLRVLLLMVPGDLAANTPLECLLETGEVDLFSYYVTPGNPLALPIPEHDVLLVAMGDSEENRPLLAELTQVLTNWPKPVINAPQHIPNTDRRLASQLLQNAPGLVIPPTLYASRATLQAIAAAEIRLVECLEDCDFPIILRPVGSQAGRDLDKIESLEQLAAYLDRVEGDEFFVARFVDYSSNDGLFRKFRVALIDGVAFACHMGVSSHWMVHYVNAGMYEEAQKRQEEANFMAHFDDFALRHGPALEAVCKRIKLDYLCIDCAETWDGQLLIFEVDHCMVVHAMDTEEMFPYKQVHMLKVKNAFQNYLFRLSAAQL